MPLLELFLYALFFVRCQLELIFILRNEANSICDLLACIHDDFLCFMLDVDFDHAFGSRLFFRWSVRRLASEPSAYG